MSIDEIAAVSKRLKRANDGTADHNTAMVNAVGLLLGLYARERTGEAQYVESTMIAANAYANIDDFYWHEGKHSETVAGRQTGTVCTPSIDCTGRKPAGCSWRAPLRTSGRPCVANHRPDRPAR